MRNSNIILFDDCTTQLLANPFLIFNQSKSFQFWKLHGVGQQETNTEPQKVFYAFVFQQSDTPFLCWVVKVEGSYNRGSTFCNTLIVPDNWWLKWRRELGCLTLTLLSFKVDLLNLMISRDIRFKFLILKLINILKFSASLLGLLLVWKFSSGFKRSCYSFGLLFWYLIDWNNNPDKTSNFLTFVPS